MLADFVSKNFISDDAPIALMLECGRRSGKSCLTSLMAASDALKTDRLTRTRKYPWYMFWRREMMFEGMHTIYHISPTHRIKLTAMEDINQLFSELQWDHRISRNPCSITSPNQKVRIVFLSIDDLESASRGGIIPDLIIIDDPDFPHISSDQLIISLTRLIKEKRPHLLIVGTNSCDGVWHPLSLWVQQHYKSHMIGSITSFSED